MSCEIDDSSLGLMARAFNYALCLVTFLAKITAEIIII